MSKTKISRNARRQFPADSYYICFIYVVGSLLLLAASYHIPVAAYRAISLETLSPRRTITIEPVSGLLSFRPVRS